MGFRSQDFAHLTPRGAPAAEPARAKPFTSTTTARKRQRRCATSALPARRVILAEAGRLVVEVYIATVSELNASGSQHWRVRQERAKSQRQAFALCMAGLKLPELPVRVTWTRKSPRLLDAGDNLNSFAKHLRDGLAKLYGEDDRSGRYSWAVAQEKSRVRSVVIDIERVKA